MTRSIQLFIFIAAFGCLLAGCSRSKYSFTPGKMISEYQRSDLQQVKDTPLPEGLWKGHLQDVGYINSFHDLEITISVSDSGFSGKFQMSRLWQHGNTMYIADIKGSVNYSTGNVSIAVSMPFKGLPPYTFDLNGRHIVDEFGHHCIFGTIRNPQTYMFFGGVWIVWFLG